MGENKSYTIHNDTDTALWDLFCSGSKDAFSSLYEKYYNLLYSYGLSIGMDSHQVRDAIHDVFLKLYSKPKLLKTAETLRPFLFQSIKNNYLNFLRSIAKHDVINPDELDFSLAYHLDEELLAKEHQETIRAKVDYLISSLSPRQKEIIYLRFLHEMDYAEIASIMDITVQGARNLLFKAMEKMRNFSDPLLILLCVFFDKINTI